MYCSSKKQKEVADFLKKRMDESATKTSKTVTVISEPSKPKKSRPLFEGKAVTKDSNKELLRQYEAEIATGDKGVIV